MNRVKDLVPGLEVQRVHARNDGRTITPLTSLSTKDRNTLKAAGYVWNRNVSSWVYKDKLTT